MIAHNQVVQFQMRKKTLQIRCILNSICCIWLLLFVYMELAEWGRSGLNQSVGFFFHLNAQGIVINCKVWMPLCWDLQCGWIRNLLFSKSCYVQSMSRRHWLHFFSPFSSKCKSFDFPQNVKSNIPSLLTYICCRSFNYEWKCHFVYMNWIYDRD